MSDFLSAAADVVSELAAAGARQMIRPGLFDRLTLTPAELAEREGEYRRWCAMSDADVVAEVSANLKANEERWKERRERLVALCIAADKSPAEIIDALEDAGYLAEF
jgi:hypothetical protein